jgi:fused signal recognition particle receptor
METWLVVSALVGLVVVALAVFYGVRRSRARREARPEAVPAPPKEGDLKGDLHPPQAVPAVEGAPLSQRLSKTRGALWGGLRKFWDRSADRALQSDEWEQLEEALLGGDVGVATTQRLLDQVKGRLRDGGDKGLRDLIEEESLSLFAGLPHGAKAVAGAPKPQVISIVGVNGVGKTTTIGKLARRLIQDGQSVLLGAGDTFRAAAITQLKVWADRSGAQFVTGREGADPGAVAFDSVSAAKARNVDVVLLDTAGRLHTKTNLMDELKKVHRVVKKVIPEAPHEVWLVIDGTLGQNSIQQAREFQKALDLTGVIVTKLDGTAKGGAVLAIASELKLPIRYIGVGESAEDLIPFEPKPFVDAILGPATA